MNCKNCHTDLSTKLNYCPDCGAKIIKNRLTIKNIWSDIVEQFFNVDNTLFKTFLHLFTKPETVIIEFINGTRKKYLNIIQYFAIGLTLAGIQVFLMNTFFKDSMEFDLQFLKSLETPESQKNNPLKDFNFEAVNNYQSIIYVLSVPVSAVSTWLAYWVSNIRRYNFTEHVVINLYYSAQVIIITAVLSILFLCFGFNYLLISGYISILTYGYLFYVLKRVFAMTFWNTLLHFLLVMLFIVLLFLAIVIFGGIIVAIVMVINPV